jgi:hypothetical protein
MVRLETADPERNGKRERRLRLIKQPIGDPSTAAASYITPEKAQELYPAEWDYFNKHGDMPMTGTALSELPGISVSQIQIMQLSGLRSIEDVLAVGEEVIGRIGHDGRFVRSVAEEWQKRRDENSDMMNYAEAKASSDAALNAERQARQALEDTNAQLSARLEALEKMMAGGATGGNAMMNMDPPTRHDEGADIDDTPNPLAEGSGLLDDNDPLTD